MQPLVEALNRWGHRGADFAWPLFWQSSLLIGVLFLLDVLLRRHTRAVLRYALWLLVLLKLLLPASLALPTGLGYWLGSDPATMPPAQPTVTWSTITLPNLVPLPPVTGVTQPSRPGLTTSGRLGLAWFAGSVLLLGLLTRRSWQAARLLHRAGRASDELTSLLDACRRRLAVRRAIRLRLSPSTVSPAVCGLFLPTLLLPRDLARRLTSDQLRAVLLHELAHVKRHDVWVNCLQAILQVVYWWHPLVWLANARIRRVREEAVDETVMVALGPQADTYPATLVEVARLAFARPLTALGLVGIFESKGALQQRIRRLIDRPVPRSAKLNFAGLLAVAACGAVLLPMARGQRALSTPARTEIGIQLGSYRDGELLPRVSFQYATNARYHRLSGSSMATGSPSSLTPAGTPESLAAIEGPPAEVTSAGTDPEPVLKAADRPIKDMIEAWATSPSPANPDSAHLETRIFRVDPNTFVQGLLGRGPLQRRSAGQTGDGRIGAGPDAGGPRDEFFGIPEVPIYDHNNTRSPFDLPRSSIPGEQAGYAGGGGSDPRLPTGTNSTQAIQDGLRAFFAAAGVNVEPPNQIYFKDRTGVLMVRATPAELDLVEKAIGAVNAAPPQITIEAKFMDAPDDFVESLKRLTPGSEITGPDATNQMHVLSDPQARVLVRALEGTAGVEVLSAPKVTTLSGRQTQIQVVDVQTIRTGIDPRALAEPGLTTTGTTNASPFLSHPMPLGPTLDLIPVVTQDGYALELTAVAGLTEFLGYDRATNTVTVHVNGERKEVEPPQPRVRTRQVNGRALVWDGQSLLLIGPAAAMTNRFADKVPVLGDVPGVGRLFRQEGTFTTNRRLLILITPTIVDPAGNPTHAPGDLPFDPNSIPPQPK